MKTFDILDRHESVHRHAILEASAGTGKTYTIENIVARLLIEPRPGSDKKGSNNGPLSLGQILVVTFTRAATRELKDRIRKKLESDLFILTSHLNGKPRNSTVPNYLDAVIENGYPAIQEAVQRLKEALINFDQAQIFTIHSFCWRMLQSFSLDANINVSISSHEDAPLEKNKITQAIRDFLRTELSMPLVCSEQLTILAAGFNNDEDILIKTLAKDIEKGVAILPSCSFHQLFEEFCHSMATLKNTHHLEPEKIKDDLQKIAQNYKLHDKQKELKSEYLKGINTLAALFHKDAWVYDDLKALVAKGLVTTEAFTAKNLRSKSITAPSQLHTSNLLGLIKRHLASIVDKGRNFAAIYSTVAANCQTFINNVVENEELHGHYDLLKRMKSALENASFRNKVRACYSAAIVDEFQDTDPLQWQIFSSLFANKTEPWEGFLTLVGDPKQSIYAFRQADIYTYLSAVETLGKEAQATLNTNYRSHPRLIDALNCLFTSAQDIFSLPRIETALPFRIVKACVSSTEENHYQKPRLEFWQVKYEKNTQDPLKEIEKDYFFPAIAEIIITQHINEDKPLNNFAILVADRHQGRRVSSYLKSCGIEVKPHRGKDITLSPAIYQMKELITGILNFHSRSSLITALGGSLIGMSHCDVIALEDEKRSVEILTLCKQFKEILLQEGFAQFFRTFLMSHWHQNGCSILENLLASSRGYELYRQLQDLSDIMIEEQQSNHLHAYGLLNFLDRLLENKNSDEEKYQGYIDITKDGVSVLTTHISKGLEFDTVFSLGLINRSKAHGDGLIPLSINDSLYLTAALDHHESLFMKYCEEIDAEKLRQLYVALTRAKSKLYVPTFIQPKHPSHGTASPLELLLAKIGNCPKSYHQLYESISSEDGSTLTNFVNNHKDLIDLHILSSRTLDSFQHLGANDQRLSAPPKVTFNNIPQEIQSYSSIVLSSAKPNSVDIEHLPPHDFTDEEKTSHTIPSGNEIGILLHAIFETLPYPCTHHYQNAEEFHDMIIPYVCDTPFNSWSSVIGEMVFKALKTPLPGCSESFSLADVHPNKTYRETEFLYPYDPCQQPIFDDHIKPAYIKGVIDLFFEHQGKYYLVDWKSNWLGPTNDYYTYNKLEEAMLKNRYDLQAAVYMRAMERYLKLFDARPFHEIFGGTFYIFLRGVGKDTGILHLPSPKQKVAE